ncbi:dTDP-4-dehydrorhamnose 3,5-epimerase [Calothrix sp. 336/3]|uniref:dTDP-4-dehydrorhamnose 3,5-epimerase n=1 Tax=Calothrix sp. 336/3 TaxID=1337936 RepID=UPI0004E43A65|nr:dTDP-4-dehydrorhamnose 3,5-epimerase [Calothrix sp. 336/3]AKG22258.1 dTDP-4-dehydrorhamnose 3,5-epimerase [Calothrix sp. 336/3]
MIATPTQIPDVLLLQPKVFPDERGFLFESFNQQKFLETTGIKSHFVQDNHSFSHRNVLRGLHYQIHRPQGKLVRVCSGKILDVAVDIRKSSPTLGKWVSSELSAENKYQLWIPPGFAHGFVVLSETAEVLYKTTEYYVPEYNRCIIWNDQDLSIDWHLSAAPILSAKDQVGERFTDAEIFD